MASPLYIESLIASTKRLRITPPKPSTSRTAVRCLATTSSPKPLSEPLSEPPQNAQHPSTTQPTPSLRTLRLPKPLQALYLAPLRHTPTHGLPVCNLQLRSHSIRNLELYADFAMRAAYYLGLPAKGPVPLPKRIERWTTIRSNFVHKKSQENFERVTYKRLVQVQDGDAEVVAVWLAYLKRNQYYGIGMKANVYEHTGMEPEERSEGDLNAEGQRIRSMLGEKLAFLESRLASEAEVEEKVIDEPFKSAWGAYAPMGGAGGAPSAGTRFEVKAVANSERGSAKIKTAQQAGHDKVER